MPCLDRPSAGVAPTIQGVTVAYGFGIEDELHRVLRGRPPADALAWVEQQLGARVEQVEPLEGGRSAAVHRLFLAGGREPVVLRRYVRDWVRDEPEIPVNEAHVLRFLTGHPAIPAPHLLAADPLGAETGVPTTVMTSVPGSVVWHPDDLESWLRRLAELLPVIHGVRVPADAGLAEWAPYGPEIPFPPPWSRHPSAWQAALSAYEGPRPEFERVFVHRDYHPGNLLWTDGEITGVVDWVSSCVGPAEEDVAHCRINLCYQFDMSVADRFLDLWLSVTGRDSWNPYHDLVNAVSMVENDPDPKADEFIAAAIRRS